MTIMLQGEDVETCELTFSITSGPTSGGSLTPITDQSCTSGNPNSDTALLTFTYQAFAGGEGTGHSGCKSSEQLT